MPVFQNTYRKLDRDTAHNKYDNQSMYDCRNMRITSNDPRKSGALSSVLGNSLKLSFDDTAYPNDRIIGSKKLRNNMILFTTNDDSESPTASYGRIWKAPLDNETLSVSDLTLCYSGLLNFSMQNPIEDAVTFYESEDIQKIYWTDNYNYLRYANVADTNIADLLLQDVDEFNIVQECDMSIPEYSSIAAGNIPVGMVQYAYRLYKLHGPASNFSPVSTLIPLTTSSYGLRTTVKFKGADRLDDDGTAKSSGKGVIISISGIDTDYDRIEIVALHHQALNEPPNIYIVDVKPTAASMTIFDDGTYNLGTYSLTEFLLISNPFKCKTIATKNNILFAGNIQQEEFDFDYDARAYRWHIISYGSSGYCNLYESDGTYWRTDTTISPTWIKYDTDGTALTSVASMADLPDDIDAICRNDTHFDKLNSSYRYQSDISTLGGEGPNVKYTFSRATERRIDNAPSGHMSFFTYLSSGEYMGPEHPEYNQELRSWCYDETYRVGLVGYDDKGRVSPVKWIGDIRMPPSGYTFSGTSGSNYTVGQNTYSTPIKLEFTISNLPDEVKYVQIVHVKRTEKDKTVKFEGLMSHIHTVLGRTFVARPDDMTVSHYNGSTNIERTHLAVFSPEISFYKDFNQTSGDYIELMGTCIPIVDTETDSAMAKEWEGLKCTNFIPTTNRYATVNDARIQETTISPDSEPMMHSFASVGSYEALMGYLETISKKLGNLGTCVLININSALDTSSLTGTNVMMIRYHCDRYGSQYGGNTYEDRTRNEYIASSGLATVTAGSATVNATKADTFIAFSDHQMSYYNGYIETLSAHTNYSAVGMFPCQTTVNLAYRLDDCWSKIYTSTPAAYWIREVGNSEFTVEGETYSNGWTDLYLENTVYIKQSDTQKFYPAPLDYEFETHVDTLVMASDMKAGMEAIDPWSRWATNETINVDNAYGQINKLYAWKNYLLYWQDDAVGMLSILDRSVVSDQAGRNVSIGEGSVLSRYDHISTNIGLNTRFSLAESPNAIYWYDHRRRDFWRFLSNIEDMKTIRGLNSYFNSLATDFSDYDNTISTALSGKGFFMSYNPIYNEIWFSIKDSLTSGETLIYNEILDSYTSFLDNDAGHYFMNFNNKFYSTSLTSLYREDVGYPGSFYGTMVPISVVLIINPMQNLISTFTNYEVTSEVYTAAGAHVHTRTIDTIRTENDYQDTGIITLGSTNSRRLLRTWRIDAGRNSTDTARLRDTYAKVTMAFTNDTNYHELVLHDFLTMYMVPAETVANKVTDEKK